MVFAHDTEAALVAAAALVNTGAADPDALATPAQLTGFLDAHRFTGRREGTAAELAAVRALRAELRDLWRYVDETDTDAVVAGVNALLARTGATPRLAAHDGWPWHLHVTEPAAPLADRMGAEAAMALADVVRAEELGRLRSCAAPGCAGVLVDLSRNSSRRFCDTACANRTHAAAFRARQRSG